MMLLEAYVRVERSFRQPKSGQTKSKKRAEDILIFLSRSWRELL